jgi:membrane fusion protein (multidrug efflux system)
MAPDAGVLPSETQSETGGFQTLPRLSAAPTRAVQRFKPGKRALGLAAGAALGVAASWYGWSYWTVGRFLKSTDDAYVGADVTVIAPKVAGFIDQVLVTDNQRVRAGDVLVKLDDRDYRAHVAHAEANVAARKAAIAHLEATRRLQQAVVEQSRAEISATTAETVRTKFDIDRFRQLTAREFASVQRLEQADADYKKSLAAGVKAVAMLAAAERQLDVIDQQKRQAEAVLELAQLNLGYTEIRAPIDGVVGNRSARQGAYATVGAQILSVVPASGLWVDANFKESQIAGFRSGMPATIQADVLPGEVFRGHVASLAPATGAQFSVLPAENATGNFTKIVQRVPVRIVLDGEASTLGRLRPGLSVTVAVDERPAAERVP